MPANTSRQVHEQAASSQQQPWHGTASAPLVHVGLNQQGLSLRGNVADLALEVTEPCQGVGGAGVPLEHLRRREASGVRK
jgi:hypothetical protein